MLTSNPLEGQMSSAESRTVDGTAQRAVFGASVGTMLEYYDFAVYAYVAAIISRKFFSGQGGVEALLATFLTFGIGYVARPLGGFTLGMLADVRGRKFALLVTMFCMAISTAAIGLLPTYRDVGIAAPALLLIARCAQGFAAGGEAGSSMSFIVEWAPRGRRGWWGSFQQVGMMSGLLLGSGVVAFLNTLLQASDMDSWGWRVPFLLGGLIGPFGMLMRRSLSETPEFVAEQAKALSNAVASTGKVTATRLTRAEWLMFVNMVVFPVGSIAAFYLLFVFMPFWLQHFAKVPVGASLWANTLGLLVIIITTPLMGAFSDRIGRRPVLLGSLVAFLFVPYAVLHGLLALPAIPLSILIGMQALFGVIVGAACGPFPAVMAEQFKTRRRSTMLNLVIALTTSAAGGFSPFIAMWLISRTGSPLAHVYYIIVAVIVSLPTILVIKETAFTDLKH
ncbi:MFS transporter [Paraburkholderia caribensis]|uniref:MFS transporter n=1 Tax=Paraburkholderia caribensis TaxID=75105 RepID=UPI0031D8E0DA